MGQVGKDILRACVAGSGAIKRGGNLIGNFHTGLITNLLLGRVLPESKIAKALLYPITPSKLLLSNCPFVVAERRTCGIK